jgi:hypothetical protein
MLRLRTACGATRTTEFHQLPKVFVVPLSYPMRPAGDFLNETPFMHVPKIDTRRFQLSGFIRASDGEVVGGEYVEIEGQ